MKEIAISLFIFFLCFFCQAQNNTAGPADHRDQYLYENFAKGTVLMKSGAVEEALLDYNTADQSILFKKQDGSILTLTGLEAVDTIYFNNKKFIPGPDGLIYEAIINNAPKISLYVTYSSKLIPATAVTDQSGTTHKEASTVSNTVTGAYVLRPYQGDFIVDIRKNYWLIKARQTYRANSEKQFNKVFPHKDAAIRKYIADNQVDFKVEEDMVKLVLFCNGLL